MRHMFDSWRSWERQLRFVAVWGAFFALALFYIIPITAVQGLINVRPCLTLRLSVCLFVCLSVCLSVCQPELSVDNCACLSVCLSVCLRLCLYW